MLETAAVGLETNHPLVIGTTKHHELHDEVSESNTGSLVPTRSFSLAGHCFGSVIQSNVVYQLMHFDIVSPYSIMYSWSINIAIQPSRELYHRESSRF